MTKTLLSACAALFAFALATTSVDAPSACPGDDDNPKSFFCPGDDDNPKS